MSRKTAVKNTPKIVANTAKKATSPRRRTLAQDLAPTHVEALPTTPAEILAAPVAATELAPDFAPIPVVAPTVLAVAPYTIARAEFDTAVRREAWLKAERRGFRNGSAFEDWIRAEAGVRARLEAEGVSVR